MYRPLSSTHFFRWTLAFFFLLWMIGGQSFAQEKKQSKIEELIMKSRAALDSGNYITMRQYAQSALELSKQKNDQSSAARAMNYLGISHELKGEYAEAIELYLKALNIQKRINDKINISSSYTNLGLVYWTQGNLSKALDYFEQSLYYNKINKDTNGMASSYNNMGLIYMDSSNYSLSAKFFLKSIRLDSIMNNRNGIGGSYNNLGLIYRKDKNYPEAIKYFELSRKIHQQSADIHGLVNTTINLGLVKEDQGLYNEAEREYRNALTQALVSGNRSQLKEVYKRLYVVAELQNKSKPALEFYKLMTVYEDSIANDEQVRKQTEAEMQFDFDQKTAKAQLQKEKDDLLNQQARQRLVWWIIGMVIFAVIVTIFSLIINKRRRLEQHQKEIIAEKNQEILDSIQYAKRIQSAILPTQQKLNASFSDYFIYYKPKDIVAGDFYWIEKVGHKVLFAVADCTGHGVPGALISVVCHNALNRAVREFHLVDPGAILNKTRELIIEEFIKSDEKIRDGMDISLCCLDLKAMQLKWSGANSPLWIKRNGSTAIEVFKAQKQPIGYFDELESFSSLSFELSKGDSIYLFSDGYADQFGGATGKKMKSKGMHNLILELDEKSMTEQHFAFENHFEKWKGLHEQIDDVCVFGVQV